jgi:hypothetical protein
MMSPSRSTRTDTMPSSVRLAARGLPFSTKLPDETGGTARPDKVKRLRAVADSAECTLRAKLGEFAEAIRTAEY